MHERICCITNCGRTPKGKSIDYCPAHYARKISGKPAMDAPIRLRLRNGATPIEKLYARAVLPRSADDCWGWTGALHTKGYPMVGRDYAHRMAWNVAYGPIPAGLFVCHTCDNPPCCNPRHLFLGTDADNKADMRAKGRHAKGNRLPSKLSPVAVLAIRASAESNGALARRYGVSSSTIGDVRARRTWNHL